MKNLIRLLICVLVICLSFSLCAFAKASFTDVSESYWGYQAINIAAEAEIINGYPEKDGTFTFKPEADVSQQESKVMAGRTMKAMSLIEEAPAFDNSKRIVATREWVANMTMKELELNSSPVMILRYKDYSNISSDCVPAIDAMYRYGLMMGDTKGNINASAGIKRAEFATICSRMLAMDLSASTKSRDLVCVEGKATSINASKLAMTVETLDGSQIYVKFNKDAKFLLNGKEATYPEFAKVAEQGFALGCIAGASNTIVVDTQISVQTGVVKEVKACADYSLVNINGIYYALDEKTVGTPREGQIQSFISSGVKLIEIK